jgi:predicted transcriptional regulator
LNNVENPCGPSSIVIDRLNISLVRQLLVPTRIAALELIHKSQTITFPELASQLGIKNHALDVTIKVLKKFELVEVDYVANPGHGLIRRIRSLIDEGSGPASVCFKVQICDELPL